MPLVNPDVEGGGFAVLCVSAGDAPVRSHHAAQNARPYILKRSVAIGPIHRSAEIAGEMQGVATARGMKIRYVRRPFHFQTFQGNVLHCSSARAPQHR